MKAEEIKIWGKNQYGQEIKEHDKLLCGSGLDRWYTHVMFDNDSNRWHREQDYSTGILVGKYE
jgi:hypothetical protein